MKGNVAGQGPTGPTLFQKCSESGHYCSTHDVSFAYSMAHPPLNLYIAIVIARLVSKVLDWSAPLQCNDIGSYLVGDLRMRVAK